MNRLKKISLIILAAYLVLSLSSLFAVIWINEFFSDLNMEQILFHVKAPLEGTDDKSIYSGLLRIALPAVILASLIMFIVIFSRRRKILHRLAIFLAVCLGLSSIFSSVFMADKYFNLFQFISDQRTTSEFIEEHYVSPVSQLIFPEERRNLIYIYLESMENTFASKAEGGAFDENYIPELTRLADENISFSNNDKLGGSIPVSGTTWTIASMFAHSTGLPLKIPVSGNSMSKHTEFLPGVISIGELLNNNGYDNYLLIGSDATFGGRRLFFQQHGDYEILDYVWAKKEKKIPDGYHVWWGYEDKKLFSLAKDELTRISKKGRPFNFTMLTVDTHHEDGYLCELCSSQYDVQYANVLACSSKQVYQFVRWLQDQDFYENTTVVLVGDHLTMDADFALDIDPDYVRTTYNVFINPAPGCTTQNTNNRIFTAFDYLPTTLASIGVSIRGEKIGLGTNLFATKKTLYEEFGQNFLAEINRKSKFYDREFIYRDANELNTDT